MNAVVQLILGLLVAAGGGLGGALLTYHRLLPKTSAEAYEITAAAQDKDWARFQREIDRLVKRCEKAERRAEEASEGQRDCEMREMALRARVTQLEAAIASRGEIRQRAAEVVAADRLAIQDGGLA